MTRDAEVRASEQMRDRIADMLHQQAVSRDQRSPAQIERGKPLGPRPALLYGMERIVRAMAGRGAKEGQADAAG